MSMDAWVMIFTWMKTLGISGHRGLFRFQRDMKLTAVLLRDGTYMTESWNSLSVPSLTQDLD